MYNLVYLLVLHLCLNGNFYIIKNFLSCVGFYIGIEVSDGKSIIVTLTVAAFSRIFFVIFSYVLSSCYLKGAYFYSNPFPLL